jgi:hypothetical protein
MNITKRRCGMKIHSPVLRLYTLASSLSIIKLGRGLAICTIAMSLLLLASPIQAATVHFDDPLHLDRATSITDLNVDGELYDAVFTLTSANALYGGYPGTFEFSQAESSDAIVAIRDALNNSTAVWAGAPGDTATTRAFHRLMWIG